MFSRAFFLASSVQRSRGMGVRHYQDLIAWQLATAFAAEVARLVDSGRASVHVRYRNQLLTSAESVSANVAEGFIRFSRADFRRFLDYALGSLAEAETRLEHGVARGYFTRDDTDRATRLARRCLTAMVRLKQSQSPSPAPTTSSAVPMPCATPSARTVRVAPVGPVAPRASVVPPRTT